MEDIYAVLREQNLIDLVFMTSRATPVPIPNTMVKPYGADDTAWEAVWESKLTPVFAVPNGTAIFRDSSMVEHSAVNR